MGFCVPEVLGEPGSCGRCSSKRIGLVETRVPVNLVAASRPGNQLSGERDRNKNQQKLRVKISKRKKEKII